MSGEEKRTRSKRCLSRNKRSKADKSTGNDPSSSEATGEVYTALKSKRTDCLHLNGRTDHLENEIVVVNEESSGVKVHIKSRSDKNDVFEFHDEASDEASDQSTTGPLVKNKRKRISSEELETSCFTSTVSRFKRARNAITCLKQPLIQLEKCTDNTGSETIPTDESPAGNMAGDCTEVLSHYLEEGENTMQEVGGETSVLRTLKEEVNSSCNDVGQVGTDDVQDNQDLKLQESRKDCNRKRDCPVCSLTFPPTDNMDVINRHINSCLDSGSDCKTRESDSSEPGTETIGEMFFCQLCQKDLSRMNSQRRQQHVNRCCDEASKTKDTVHLNRVQGQTSTQLQCPICGKGFKSSKSRQAHLKKCAQEYNVGTNQLLEIMHHEKHQEDSTSVAAIGNDAKGATEATSENPGRVKRKRRAVLPKSDLDEQTQIVLALSASIAPPPPSDAGEGKNGKRKGKKKKGGNELPPLLLRDDKTAQRTVAIRAAQVLFTQEDNDEDDEISCTPALAPSRLAQNVPPCGPPVTVDAAGCTCDGATTSVCKGEVNESMDVDSENEKEQDEKSRMSTFAVDPALSKSFLNFLYDIENEERQAAEVQAPHPSPLWALAALKEESFETFYVQGLLPPASPQRPKNLLERVTFSGGQKGPTVIDKPAIDLVETTSNSGPVSAKTRLESAADLKLRPTGNTVECSEITLSQAVNVEMLLELAGEDDISNMSMDSQQMMAASGFCVDEQDEENQKSDAVPSGVPRLLQDLSSVINNPHLSDVVISLRDGQEMVAHSFILSLRSDVLAQLLSEEKAFSRWQDKTCLKFNDVCQPVFEVVLRHMYTGDVTIPVQSVDEVADLAARLKLPCLLAACNVMKKQMNKVSESQEDEDIIIGLATDLEKLEEYLWRNGEGDDQISDVHKEEDDKDDFLNDDDIEEIMLFQTQALKMKESVGSEGLEEKDEKFLTAQTEREETSTSEVSTVVDNMLDEESSSNSLENKREKVEPCPNMNKGNLSHNVVEEGTLPCYNAATDNVLHNSTVTNGLSCNSVDSGETTLPFDFTERKDKNKVLVLYELDVERMIKNEQSCFLKEHQEKKELMLRTSSKTSHKKNQIEKPETFLWGDRHSSCDASTCELDPISEQPQSHVEGAGERTSPDMRAHFEVVKELSDNKEFPGDYGDCVMEIELEYNEHFVGMSKGSFNNKCKGERDDVKEVEDTNAMNKTSSNFQLCRKEGLDVPDESANKRAYCLSPPSRESLWDNEKDLQEPSREVTLLGNDEIEEKAVDESITLLSDSDLDGSSPKAHVAVVPETPRVARSTHQFRSSSSLSTLSGSEEDVVSETGFLPSKTRKQLSEEANDFLSKLKQRVDRDKDKRRGKGKRRKKAGPKESACERSVKETPPRKRSPCARHENCVDTSPLACDVRSSVTSHRHRTASPIGEIPRGLETCGSLSLRESPRDVEPRIVSPERISPGCSQQFRASPIFLQENCVSDCVVIEHSPPLSPDLFQPQHESPQNSAYEEKEGETESIEPREGDSLGDKKINFDNQDDVVIMESCADQTAVNVSRPLVVSTSSSPREVMSPPVSSPEYSFLEPVSHPGSPMPYASPVQNKIVSPPGPVSPGLPVHWKSTQAESKLDACAPSNSPVSPSVCSFSSQIPGSNRKRRHEESASRKLDLENSLNNKENAESRTDVREIDPNLPLMERIRAARNGGRVMYKVKDVKEDGSDNDSDKDCMEDKSESNRTQSPQASSQQDKDVTSAVEVNEEENISLDANLDFYDDGGYNFDVEELQNLERVENDNQTDLNEQGECNPEEDKMSQRDKASKAVGNKRKFLRSQRRKQDVCYEDRPQKTQKKRGKRADSETIKSTAQTVRGPITPMPNYNDMATPVLKNELHKFGVRPLPKKKMVKKLKEIYDYTHQVEPLSQQSEKEPAVSDSQSTSSNVMQQDFVDGVEGSGTASSDNSDEEDTEFGDCTVMIEDEAITASQQVNGGNLKEKLLGYMSTNKELYRKLLKFQPLELVSLHQQIKSDGINCSLGKLVDFLDEQCITFTTAGSRPRAPRKGGRKKKINNKP